MVVTKAKKSEYEIELPTIKRRGHRPSETAVLPLPEKDLAFN